MSKHDVIHKTGSTQRINTPPQKDRATAIGNRHKKFGEDWTCSSEDMIAYRHTHTHTHPFNGPLSGTTVSRYQKGKTNLDFTEARDSEWQWHQLGHIQVCISFQTDNQTSTPPLFFYRPDALPAAQPTASKH